MANLTDIGYGIGKYLTVSDASGIPDIGANRKNLGLLNFKVATNNAYALYNFKDGMIDAYQTEAGVDTSGSTNETYDSTNKLYSPTVVAAATTAVTATGASTWTCPTGVTSAEILIVAGGGGSGASGTYGASGGGGAGGVVYDADYTVVPAVVYDVTVGAGGIGGVGGNTIGVNGGDSVWNVNAEGSGLTQTSVGGGGGSSGSNASGSGGSGGGGSMSTTGASGTQGDSGGGTGFGNDGGDGYTGGGTNDQGAGGGGAGAVGGNAISTVAGNGGVGKDYSSIFGTGVGVSGWFAGGGGGGSVQNSTGSGGQGGGGAGGTATGGAAGTVNTGGGGGGTAAWLPAPAGNGYAGGSGVIIIKTAEVQTNMTLLSNTQISQADPTEGRLMLYEEDVDSITLDTDLKGYVSRDGGTTYTQTPLTEDTTYEAGKRLLSGSVDISGQPAGSNMKYKVETLNEKNLKLHGASLLWA